MFVCECIHGTLHMYFKEGADVSWYSACPCQLTKWEGPESQILFFVNMNGRAHPKFGTGCYITKTKFWYLYLFICKIA